jgi:hypothetical protein
MHGGGETYAMNYNGCYDTMTVSMNKQAYKNTCIARGLHKWKDIQPLSKTLEKELTHTWWIVRRIVAWAAKTPDDHLPPIIKEKSYEKMEKIIDDNIYWDGTLINQLENI